MRDKLVRAEFLQRVHLLLPRTSPTVFVWALSGLSVVLRVVVRRTGDRIKQGLPAKLVGNKSFERVRVFEEFEGILEVVEL